MATVTMTATPVHVLAVNDAAGTLQGEAVTIRPLTNDRASVGGTLTIIAVTTPAHGTVMLDSDGQAVHYTPAANFSGLDGFRYTVQHSTGERAMASVAIVVSAKAEAAAPIVAPVDTTTTTTATFSSGDHQAMISVPPGTYTGTLGATDLFYIAYTAIVTPTSNVTVPPTGGLQFGELLFTLDAFVNENRLDSYHFPEPLTLTLSYAAAAGILNPHTLQLYYWTGDQWSMEGLTFVAIDEVNRTITYRVAHFTEFALFGVLNPTVIDEDDEPPFSNRLYLPLITR